MSSKKLVKEIKEIINENTSIFIRDILVFFLLTFKNKCSIICFGDGCGTSNFTC